MKSRVCAGLHWKFFFRSQEMVPPNPHSNMFGFEYPQAPPVRPRTSTTPPTASPLDHGLGTLLQRAVPRCTVALSAATCRVATCRAALHQWRSLLQRAVLQRAVPRCSQWRSLLQGFYTVRVELYDENNKLLQVKPRRFMVY